MCRFSPGSWSCDGLSINLFPDRLSLLFQCIDFYINLKIFKKTRKNQKKLICKAGLKLRTHDAATRPRVIGEKSSFKPAKTTKNNGLNEDKRIYISEQ